MLLAALVKTVDRLLPEFDEIPFERRQVLRQLADLVRGKVEAGQPVLLTFICTHNSRRSHMAQLWAQAAAYRYSLPGVQCYSGGTEATAFNPGAIHALEEAGFDIRRIGDGINPRYAVRFAPDAPPVISFSKLYDDPGNVPEGFVAVMTCSQADEGCPVVTGASARVRLFYDDPKNSDGSPSEKTAYRGVGAKIAREMLYAFSQV